MMMMIMVKVVIVMILMMMLRRQMGMIMIMIMIMMTLIMLIINKKWTFIGNNALREFSRIKMTTDHIALDRVCDDIDEGRNQSRS